MPGFDLLPGKRECVVAYRNSLIKVPCNSVSEELELKMMSVVKTQGVEQRKLELFTLESEIVAGAPKTAAKGPPVDVELLKSAAGARASLASMLSDNACKTGDEVSKLLAAKRHDLVLLDSSFLIELAWLNSLLKGDAGACCLRRAVLAILPPKGLQEASVCYAQLQLLKKSELHKFSSRGAQSHLGIVCDLVAQVVDRRPLVVTELLKDMYLRQVVGTMAYFVRVSEGGKGLHGADALVVMIDALRAAVAKGCATMDQVHEIRTFGWLLSDDQRKLVNEAAAKVSDQTVEALKAQSSKAKSHKAKAMEVSSAKASERAVAMAADMFA
jgi:hypothetical protein